MVPEGQSTDTPYGGDPIGPGLFTSLRRVSGTKRGRSALLLAVGILVILVLFTIGLVIFSSISSESQSYKDGFSVGGAVYAADAAAQLDAQQACEATELRGPHHGGLPSGDNAEQWRQGCVAAFASAQADN
jgi:threonine/homoserine/homoserine lactone efflux protein